MKEIVLTQGKVALIDDEDYYLVSNHKWYTDKSLKTFYARTNLRGINGKQQTLYLHQLIMNSKKGQKIDHKDRNGLNCQKSNLRFTNGSENNMNQGISSRNKSGYKGVSFHKGDKKWRAYIQIDKKWKFLGNYNNKEDAARAYNKSAIENFRQFAVLNEIGK